MACLTFASTTANFPPHSSSDDVFADGFWGFMLDMLSEREEDMLINI